ncbi:unnamed protein product [Calypogeia fissa]
MGDLLCIKILTVLSKTATRPSKQACLLAPCSASHAHSPSSRVPRVASKPQYGPDLRPSALGSGAAVPLLFRGPYSGSPGFAPFSPRVWGGRTPAVPRPLLGFSLPGRGYS